MIQEMTYSNVKNSQLFNGMNYQQNQFQTNENEEQEVIEPRVYKKQAHDYKYIKQLKAKDIKLSLFSHKKFQPNSNKASAILKNNASYQNQKEPIEEQCSSAYRPFPSQQLKKPNKYRNPYMAQKQKQKIAVEVISSFNPQQFGFSKETSIPFIQERSNKKSKNAEITNSTNLRARQSRSQNKRQKLNSSNLPSNNFKNSMNHQIHSNIFQNLDILSKQQSYHSLQKGLYQPNTNFLHNHISAKIQEKIHLPSLVNNNGLRNVKNKIQNMNIMNQNNQIQAQKSHIPSQGIIMTQKSSPYIQKLVKIPLDRLKPLKPEQIKLKYQRKVKQQQKNRAKEIALHIFSKQEQEAQKRRILHTNEAYDLQQQQRNENMNENRRIQNQQQVFDYNKNKTSLIKKEKLAAYNKAQNVFKKHVMAYN